MICPWSTSGRHTCFQIIRALGQLLRNVFWRGPVSLQLLRRSTAASSAESPVGTAVVFLRIYVSTILSTVAAHSPINQGLSCFCPEIVIGGDDYSAFHFFGQLLDGLLELDWVRGSEVEPAKAEFYSFVREQRQVETSSHRSRAPINSVFAFCSQPSFRSRRNLHKYGILCLRIVLIVS